jgi:hypothetical protein
MIKNKLLLLLLTFVFISCDFLTHTNKTNTNTKNSIGYLVDANVSGVEYYCSDDIKGITNRDGSFEFNYNCNNIIFSLGSIILADISIANVKKDNIFYITDIVQRDLRNDTNNSAVINIIRVLQTLDDDNNPKNGIHITKNTRDNIPNHINYPISSENISEQDLQNIVGANTTLIDPIKALVHFEQTLRANNIYVDTVPPYKPYLTNDIIATSEENTSIDINGEQNTKILLNKIDTNLRLDKDGSYKNFILNTSHYNNSFKEFNISLQDDTNKTSQTLMLTIFKDTEFLEGNLPLSPITISSPNKYVTDLNITDNSLEYGLKLIYKITGKDKNLFIIITDQNSTKLYFKEDTTPSTYNINIEVLDFASHHKDTNLTILVN